MQKLVVFSGAGMSAESGIQTFRDHDGLWENYNIEDVATPEAWARNPQLVQDFYNQRRKHILQAQPNRAHQLISQLQQYYHVNVITQNIDDLHERAGNDNVLHLHGNIRFSKSSGPHAEYSTELYPIDGWELNLKTDLCPAGYPLRPHVVWFGEAVPAYADAQAIVQNADIFIVIGTSLEVYPVAGLVHEIPPRCTAYYIDPKAHHLNMPVHYHVIAKTATEGMQQLYNLLTKS